MLDILIIIEKFRTGKSCVLIHISCRQIDDLRMLSSRCVTGWGWWHAGWRWSWLWSQLSASGRWRCTRSIAAPAYLRNFRGAILGRKTATCLVLMKHCWVSLYCSLHRCTHRKLNTPLRLFSDLRAWILIEILYSLYCGVRKAFFGHFGHIQR
jgi:hypothetical protein